MSIIKSFSYYSMGQAVNSLLRFFWVPYYSSILTVEEFGKIGLIWIVVPFISLVAGLAGTTSVAIKFYKVSEHVRNRMLNFVLLYSTLITGILVFIVIKFHFYFESVFFIGLSTENYSKVIIIGYTAFLIEFYLGVHKNKLQANKFVLLNSLYTLVSILSILVFIAYYRTGLVGYIDGSLLGNLIMTIILAGEFFLQNKTYGFLIPKKLTKELFQIGMPVVLGVFLSFLFNFSGRYLLINITGSFENVGIYTMGTKIGELFNVFFVTSFTTSCGPVLLKIFAQDNENYSVYKQEMKRFFNIYIFTSALCLLVVNSFLQIFFNDIVDSKYVAGIPIAQLSFLGFFFFGLGQLFGMTLLAKEYMLLNMAFSGVCGVLSIGFNLLLIPEWGGIGAVSSTVLVYIVLMLLFYFFSQKLVMIDYAIGRNIKVLGMTIIAFFLQDALSQMFSQEHYVCLLLKMFIVIAFVTVIIRAHIYSELDILVKKIGCLVGGKNDNR